LTLQSKPTCPRDASAEPLTTPARR
jgi:hypothetical protein